MSSVVSDTRALYIAAFINLLIISIPLVFIDSSLGEFLGRPVTWIFYSLMFMFCVMEGKASFKIPNCRQLQAEKIFVPYLIGFCILSVLWVSIYDYGMHFQLNLVKAVIGCLLIAIGVFVRINSINKLNKYFLNHIAHLEDHHLITTGIYSIVRHPSELGMLSVCYGVTLLLASVTGFWLASIVLLPLIIYRISLEDKLLLSLFSAEYESYRSATPGLLPKLFGRSVNSAG